MKIIKHFSNIFISFVLLILIIITMFITCSKTLISKKNISEFISQANILNMDINILFNQEESGITLKEKIMVIAIDNQIPEKIIEDILESEQINELLGDFFNQTINYAINGGEKPKILDETINDMKLIAKQSLDSHINIMLESIIEIVPERNTIIGDIPVNILENILNFNVLYLYLIISLILVLISLINKSWYKFIQYLGITMLLSGLLFVIIGSMEYVITNVIVNNIVSMQSFIISLITNLLTIWFKSGVIVSFSSIVLILIYSTINRMSKN